MLTRKLALFAALAVAGVGTIAIVPQASARVGVSISVGTRPPPLRYEPVPAPRAGYVWAPGYWRWGGARYIWVGGSWHPHRSGYIYYGPRWEHSGSRWVYHDRYWGRDRGHGRDRDHDHDWDHHHH